MAHLFNRKNNKTYDSEPQQPSKRPNPTYIRLPIDKLDSVLTGRISRI